jgi:hypothetical protein
MKAGELGYSLAHVYGAVLSILPHLEGLDTARRASPPIWDIGLNKKAAGLPRRL